MWRVTMYHGRGTLVNWVQVELSIGNAQAIDKFDLGSYNQRPTLLPKGPRGLLCAFAHIAGLGLGVLRHV
jgi:hypothetical protein